MNPNTTANLHFFLMILASLLVFIIVLGIVVSKEQFKAKFSTILILALCIVVGGMLFGKYGATYGLPWWIYYPVPMLANVLLPPYFLKFNFRKTLIYLGLSFLSAPLIHTAFSFFLGWQEYMPFWKIPFWKDLMA
jgi:glucan phosphoethanolaminetransferase (alkaline phosphatase superfamily)